MVKLSGSNNSSSGNGEQKFAQGKLASKSFVKLYDSHEFTLLIY